MTVPLPEFETPPVNEVVLGVQFDAIEALHAPQLGSIWQRFRERFPKTEEHPPLDPAFEQFAGPAVGRPPVRLEWLTSLPPPRVWFINEPGTELVQIQCDRFIRNWRKTDGCGSYPRYVALRAAFHDDFLEFQNLMYAEGYGRVEATQCEVTYLNIIDSGAGWNSLGELGRVLTLFTPTYSDLDLGIPEQAAVEARFIIRNDANEAVGRLHVAAAPVLRLTDGSSAIRLTLTARGSPEGPGIDGVLQFLDRGHEAIVRGFASITTPEMHKVWRKRA